MINIYLSADDNWRQLPQHHYFYLHSGNISGDFLQDVCLQTTVHIIWVCILIQPSVKVSNNITSLGTCGYGRYFSRETPSELRFDLLSSSHEYWSAGGLPENLI